MPGRGAHRDTLMLVLRKNCLGAGIEEEKRLHEPSEAIFGDLLLRGCTLCRLAQSQQMLTNVPLSIPEGGLQKSWKWTFYKGM